MKKIRKIIFSVIVVCFVSVSLFEAAFLLVLHVPSLACKLPPIAYENVRTAYKNYRSIIQLDPLCARFDKEIGYTLKPGHCVFSNIEFKNDYFINSQGLRDTEEALHKPQVIVLGDSFSMGWGVNQQETYAKVLERESGLKVLNAAVSSYGTAREMMMLRRLDTSALKYLIIQYYENDYWENVIYYINRNSLPQDFMERNYRAAVTQYRAQKSYYWGKFTVDLIRDRVQQWRKQWLLSRRNPHENTIVFSDNDHLPRKFWKIGLDLDRDVERFFSWDQALDDTLRKDKTITSFCIDKDKAYLFLNPIIHSGVDLSHVKIIAFAWMREDVEIFESLKREITKPEYPPYIRNMILVNMHKALLGQEAYILDDHPKANSHKKVAEILLSIIKPGGYIDQNKP